MGGFLVVLLQSLVQTPEADTTTTTTDHTDNHDSNDHDLPTFVFGADGEFLGRVDTPAYAGSERGR